MDIRVVKEETAIEGEKSTCTSAFWASGSDPLMDRMLHTVYIRGLERQLQYTITVNNANRVHCLTRNGAGWTICQLHAHAH